MPLNFGFMSEGETADGYSYTHRYHDIIDETILAEKMGFGFVGLSEQHFAVGGISTSSPEVLNGYIAAVTTRIKVRTAIALMPYRINHPLRIANGWQPLIFSPMVEQNCIPGEQTPRSPCGLSM